MPTRAKKSKRAPKPYKRQTTGRPKLLSPEQLRRSTSFILTGEELAVMEKLSERAGMNRSALLRKWIRDKAKRAGI